MTTTPVQNGLAPAKRPRSRINRRLNRIGWLFLAPFALLFFFVYIIPIFFSARTSLFSTTLVRGETFVGLSNFSRLMGDANFWDSVKRVMLFTGVQVPIMLFLAVLLALAIDSKRLHGTSFFRISVFLPYAIPAIVSTLMWGFMLGVRYGLFRSINDILSTNFNPFTPPWTLVSIGVIVTWAFTGYNFLIFYSALKTIPAELYDSAAIDGASRWQIIRYIKLPAIRGSLVVTILFSIIGTFQLFNEPQILPSIVSNSGITNHYTPNLYAYYLAFTGSQRGYAAALALVMAGITVIFAYTVQGFGFRDKGGNND